MKKTLRTIIAFSLILTITGCSTMVSFNTSPEGADVYLDDDYLGKTPFTKKISNFVFKSKKIRVEKEGYTSKTQDVKKEVKILPLAFCWFYFIPLLWVKGPTPKQYIELEDINYEKNSVSNTIPDLDKDIELHNAEGRQQWGEYDFNITTRYKNSVVDIYFYAPLSIYGLSFNDQERFELIKNIEKAEEWSTIASKNKIDNTEKELPSIGCRGFFKMSDWHYTKHNKINMKFKVVNSKSFIVFDRLKMESKSNSFIFEIFEGALIPLNEAVGLKEAITASNIEAKIKEAVEKKNKEDKLFN